MSLASKGAPPQWLSTHPKGGNRIAELTKNLPKVMPLYAKALGKAEAQLPAYKSNLELLTQARPAGAQALSR